MSFKVTDGVKIGAAAGASAVITGAGTYYLGRLIKFGTGKAWGTFKEWRAGKEKKGE